MNLIVQIPDDLAQRLSAGRGDVERQALEGLAIEAFRAGQLTKPELRRMLGLGSRSALDAFLVAHDQFGTHTELDLARDREDLQRLGL